jgi:hypothetical protein
LWARNASADARAALLNDSARRATPEEIQKAADAQIYYGLAIKQVSDAATELGVTVLPHVAGFLREVNAGIKMMGFELGQWGKIMDDLGHGDLQKAQRDLKDLYGGYDKYQLTHPDKKDPSKAMDRAANKMSAAVDKFSGVVDGMYGGGNRTRGAVPSGWGPQAFDAQIRGQGINLGAFTGA